MQPKNYILIPAYNEATEQLRETVAALRGKLSDAVLVVIDDGSRQACRNILAGERGVVVLRHPINLGQGAALETGMEYARRHHAKYVFHMDADGQHSPEDLHLFQQALEGGADFVVGSRFLRKEDIQAIPRGRRLLLRLARFINFCFTGLWLTDVHNGFRAMNAHALQKIHITQNRMAHATEILRLSRKTRLKTQEIPVHVRYTDYSRQKGQKWFHSVNILFDLILRLFFP